MRSSTVFNFIKLRDPVASLAHEFGIDEGSFSFEALNFVWSFCSERCMPSKGGKLPAAYQPARDHIGECVSLFSRFEADYNFTAQERDIALAALLTPKALDPWDKECWNMLGDDVAFVLTIMDLQENLYMLPSEAGEHRPLAINVGLKALLELNETLMIHTSQKNRKFFNLASADLDQDVHYAFKILQDRPTLETALTRECRAQAKTVIDALKNRTVFSKPVLAYENRR